MSHPTLPPGCYTEQRWFDLEREKLFGQYWLLAGLTQQLRANNSFITRTLAGIPVLIQNCGGTLRAFRNACPHRGMPIQTECCGNRRLICPYHGWSFEHDGTLCAIPNETGYNFSDANKAGMNLQPYALATVGNFIFVNLAKTPLPLTEQFPENLLRLLTVVSRYFASEVSYTTFGGHYNWKLNFENVLDWNHVQYVHPRTLAPLLRLNGNGSPRPAPVENSLLFAEGRPLSDIRFFQAGAPAGQADVRDISQIGRGSLVYAPHWFSPLIASPCDRGAILASQIFPNANFGSIHGEHFYLQQYIPLTPELTEFHSWIFTAILKENIPFMPHLLWGIHHAEKRVVDEDIVVFEQVQKTFSSAHSIGVFGDNEYCLASFGRWYMQHLNEGKSHG